MEAAAPTPSEGAPAPISRVNAASIEAITIGFTFLVKSRRTARVLGSHRGESACTLAHRVRVPQAEPSHDTRTGRSSLDLETGCNAGQNAEKSRPDASLTLDLRLESSWPSRCCDSQAESRGPLSRASHELLPAPPIHCCDGRAARALADRRVRPPGAVVHREDARGQAAPLLGPAAEADDRGLLGDVVRPVPREHAASLGDAD